MLTTDELNAINVLHLAGYVEDALMGRTESYYGGGGRGYFYDRRGFSLAMDGDIKCGWGHVKRGDVLFIPMSRVVAHGQAFPSQIGQLRNLRAEYTELYEQLWPYNGHHSRSEVAAHNAPIDQALRRNQDTRRVVVAEILSVQQDTLF